MRTSFLLPVAVIAFSCSSAAGLATDALAQEADIVVEQKNCLTDEQSIKSLRQALKRAEENVGGAYCKDGELKFTEERLTGQGAKASGACTGVRGCPRFC